MFLSSPAFHPTPLHKITPFPPFPPSPSHACVPQVPLTDCLFAHRLPIRTLRANPSAGAVPARVDRRSTVAAKPPSPERRCDAANRPADARHSRRVHSHHGHRAAKPARPPAHLLVSEKTYTSRIRWLRAYYSDPLVNSGSAVLVRFVIEANWWARRIVEVPSSASDDVLLGVVTMSVR